MLRPQESFHSFPLLLHSPNTLLLWDEHEFRFSSGCWQGNCYHIVMILIIIRMKVGSEKRMELSQTIASLSGSIRMEKGCLRCDFCQGIEDEDRLFLLEEWDTQVDLMAHLKSDPFRILRGAMNLLMEPYEMVCYSVFHPAGTKNI